ncbi:hypothetical protein [Bacteroides sedimenti]|uniref:hypothetical protein n=1 Tax=Bacteroides sedimenti TaxID=2136147 RepID=UPI003341B9D4
MKTTKRIYLSNYIILLLISSIYFVGCVNKTNKVSLIPITRVDRDSNKIYVDSIVMLYKDISASTQKVTRIFYYSNETNKTFRYYLIKQDKQVLLKLSNDDITSGYLNFNKEISTKIYISHSLLDFRRGGFKFVKFDSKDSLYVFCGADMGFSKDCFYYYFDKNIRLRKIYTGDGEIFFVEKLTSYLK